MFLLLFRFEIGDMLTFDPGAFQQFNTVCYTVKFVENRIQGMGKP